MISKRFHQSKIVDLNHKTSAVELVWTRNSTGTFTVYLRSTQIKPKKGVCPEVHLLQHTECKHLQQSTRTEQTSVWKTLSSASAFILMGNIHSEAKQQNATLNEKQDKYEHKTTIKCYIWYKH